MESNNNVNKGMISIKKDVTNDVNKGMISIKEDLIKQFKAFK